MSAQAFARLSVMTEAATFAEVIEAIREQSAHLLGTTISYGEDDWAVSTPLQGWTRSHVAAHLAHGAKRLAAAIQHLDQAPAVLNGDLDEIRREIETSALQAGIGLQIELDETAGLLQGLLPKLEDVTSEVPLADDWIVPASELAVLRLRELVVHHTDLAGIDILSLDTRLWFALLAFEAQRPLLSSLPPLLLVSDEGFSARLGTGDEATTVMGPARDLFFWLARHIESPNLSGIEHLGI